MPKYKLTIDGKVQIVDIEEVEDSCLAERLDGMDLRAQDMTRKFAGMDAALGLMQLQLAAIEKQLTPSADSR